MKEQEIQKTIYVAPKLEIMTMVSCVLSSSIGETQDYNMGWFQDGLNGDGGLGL